MDDSKLEQLTNSLPPSELAQIIRRALACGREERAFTEADLRRALTFGNKKRIQRKVPVRRSTHPPPCPSVEPVTGTYPIATESAGRGAKSPVARHTA